MSSHHIVREKQEPALLIMSFKDFDNENLGQLLEWNPTVLVYEEAYDQAQSMAFKIDGLVSATDQFDVQEHTRIVLASDDPLEEALRFLVGEGYPAVNVVTPEFKLKDFGWCFGKIEVVVYCGALRIYPVVSGFSKWKPAGEKIHLMHDVLHLSYHGLKPIADGTYETEKDGFFSLVFTQPFAFIAESS